MRPPSVFVENMEKSMPFIFLARYWIVISAMEDPFGPSLFYSRLGNTLFDEMILTTSGRSQKHVRGTPSGRLLVRETTSALSKRVGPIGLDLGGGHRSLRHLILSAADHRKNRPSQSFSGRLELERPASPAPPNSTFAR